MIAILGALFLVGTSLTFFITSMQCRKVNMNVSPRYGALWALLPAFVYALSRNRYIMMISTWIPTIILVYGAEYGICKVSV